MPLQWSPEQISGWLQREYKIPISIEWIYQQVLCDKQSGGTLYRHLRCQRQRKKRYGVYSHRGRYPVKFASISALRLSINVAGMVTGNWILSSARITNKPW